MLAKNEVLLIVGWSVKNTGMNSDLLFLQGTSVRPNLKVDLT